MNKKSFIIVALLSVCQLIMANVPDSAYVFTYCTGANRGQDGLKLAWSSDGKQWKALSILTSVKSDYGNWGAQKRMLTPHVIMLPDGSFAATWALNENCPQFAVTTSSDLLLWMPQDYPYMNEAGRCLEPVASYNDGVYSVTFHNGNGEYYRSESSDFRTFGRPVKASKPDVKFDTAIINGKSQTGQIFKLPYERVDKLLKQSELQLLWNKRNSASSADNARRFGGIECTDARVRIALDEKKPISDKLIGIFFEDINYAADGGLYGELLENRDFEYNKDEGGREKNWDHDLHWSVGGDGTMEIRNDNPLHENNSYYAHLKTNSGKVTLSNDGYQGIPVRNGKKYDFSFYSRMASGQKVPVTVSIVSEGGKVLAEKKFTIGSREWKQQKAVLAASADDDHARLQIALDAKSAAEVDIDFVSLFPQDTYMGRKNGLRKDLAQVLVDMKPKFMRFPGGCVSHGNGIDNIYDWKGSVGPLIARKHLRNIWGYHQSRGLGFYEYFQFCEDAGMEPLPVLAAGVPCQNSSIGGLGQQGGIPMEQMDEYVQDILDLIEWANGDPKKSKWAKMRADAGHPKPFNLKYLGIGNEDLISKVFEDRYLMIINAVRNKYPEIHIVGTVGPFNEGSDYERGWRLAKDNNIELVDEHYYQSPGWFIYHQDYYDNYDRNASKVYLGEYAAHGPGRKNTIETALCAAMHICGMERNGDIVEMSSYAPLLAKERFTQWNPDMIYFTNTGIRLSTDYWVQYLCGNSAGDTYHKTVVESTLTDPDMLQRIAASTVTNSKTGKTYIKLVNLTGVPTVLYLDIPALSGEKEAKTMTLQGNWDDQKAKPEEGRITLSSKTNVEMSPYSFMVIEL